MRLLVDTWQVRFTVSKPPEEKKDLDGRQRSDKRTGELLFTMRTRLAVDEVLGVRPAADSVRTGAAP